MPVINTMVLSADIMRSVTDGEGDYQKALEVAIHSIIRKDNRDLFDDDFVCHLKCFET